MANIMFDTKAKKIDYDRLNSTMRIANLKYYLATSTLHTLGFMYMAYFFRFRRVNLAPSLLISCGYYYFFTKTNDIAYKVIVDKEVIRLARELGHGSRVQPVGHFKNRGLNYV